MSAHPRWFAVSLLAVGLAGPALAQTAVASPETCATLATRDQELECLRAALRISRALLDAEGSPAAKAATVPDAADGRSAELAQGGSVLLGDEQVSGGPTPEARRVARSREAVLDRVAASSTDHLGRITVRLQNGQIWQQAEPQAVPMRISTSRVQQVEITRSGFGGYRMRFPDLGRQLAVRRLK